MSEEKRQSEKNFQVATNGQTESLEKDLGIETITIKCPTEMVQRLRTMATKADMELEPFIRRLCEQQTKQDDVSTETPERKNFEWGSFRKTDPVSRDFGFAAGQPIDRFYIDLFLNTHRQDIRGHVLEVADDSYTKRFGDERVTASDILHVRKTEGVTIVGDLVTGVGIPVDTFDCIILTQTLPFIYDTQHALATCLKALKTDGVLLGTVNGISQISRYDMDRWGDYWRFTELSIRHLFHDVFKPEAVTVSTFGNVLSAVAFLLGLPAQELQQKELNHQDCDYQVLIGARAQKTELVRPI